MLSHKVIELSCEDKKIVLLGETHYKTIKDHDLCETIKSKFTVIGYESHKRYPNIFGDLTKWSFKKLMSLFPLHCSSIFDKKFYAEMAIREYPDLVEKCLTEDRVLDVTLDDGRILSLTTADFPRLPEKMTMFLDLETRDKPHFFDEILFMTIVFRVAIFLSSPWCPSSIKIVLDNVVSILSVISILPVILHTFKIGSYGMRLWLAQILPGAGLIYRRDKIMAQEIIDQQNQYNKMLIITGTIHLEGLVWYLTKHGYTQDKILSLEDYIDQFS